MQRRQCWKFQRDLANPQTRNLVALSLEVSVRSMGHLRSVAKEVLASANTQDTNATPAVLGTVETRGDFVLISENALGVFPPSEVCLDTKYRALK